MFPHHPEQILRNLVLVLPIYKTLGHLIQQGHNLYKTPNIFIEEMANRIETSEK